MGGLPSREPLRPRGRRAGGRLLRSHPSRAALGRARRRRSASGSCLRALTTAARPSPAPRRRWRTARASLPGGFMLCLGTDFLHKNRIFALRLLAALREQAGLEREARARRDAHPARILARARAGIPRGARRAARGRAEHLGPSARRRRRGSSLTPARSSIRRCMRGSAWFRSSRP